MQFSYDFSAGAEEIFSFITDPQSLVNRCMALGSVDAECQSDEADLPLITTTRVEKAEVPAIMKKIVGQQQNMQTIEQWSETEESYDSQSTTTIAGTPIEISVTQSLYNTQSGSQIIIDMVVTAKIPLIGKKIEPMVATKVRKEILKQFDYVEKALS